MVAYFTTLVRALLLAVALVFVGQTVSATDHPTGPTATARTTARTKTDAAAEHDDDFPFTGVLIIAGVVGLVILIAWVGSRIGDNRPHVIS